MSFSSPDASALRATASNFDALRDNLPVAGDPHSPLDSHTIASELSELCGLINYMADEVLFRIVDRKRSGDPAPAIAGFAAAVRPACEAATALASVAHQLSNLEQAGQPHDESEAADYDTPVVHNALTVTHQALRATADSLRDAAAPPSPEAARTQAARSRSTAEAASPSPSPAAAPPAAPPARPTRGR
ncbi:MULTISPECIES: hypothetical protein [unclassified Streptomyces]|uniref:hypothetical protein n=1 Tax=unclassified Streptomyces TaxID=2593676 RepID=UPI001C2E8C24|nr:MULTISPECIES: hypothetical protein [unclassified Streptomyces]MBV1949165.1 hypothetical protein [Streptomyces sp. BV129]